METEGNLYKHEGCKGCTKKCQYNQPVAIKEVAERSKGKLFECNSLFQFLKKELNKQGYSIRV